MRSLVNSLNRSTWQVLYFSHLAGPTQIYRGGGGGVQTDLLNSTLLVKSILPPDPERTKSWTLNTHSTWLVKIKQRKRQVQKTYFKSVWLASNPSIESVCTKLNLEKIHLSRFSSLWSQGNIFWTREQVESGLGLLC